MEEAEFLSTTKLFEGATPEEVDSMLGCLGAYVKSFRTNECIHRAGNAIATVGIVVSGCVHAENVDVWGNVSIVGEFGPGDMFGEAYAATPGELLEIDFIATRDCRVAFLMVEKVFLTCPRACPHHSRTCRNLARSLAQSNLSLSRHIMHTAPHKMRDKVMAYLSYESEKAKSKEFDIPFNRQQLANYLGVDRSALSAELSRMQSDGLLKTDRRHFVLK